MTIPCASTFVSATPDAWLDEPEAARVPEGVNIIDAHVHLFPPGVFEAIWRWFDAHAWKVRYRLHAEQVVDFLVSRGVKQICALHYSHKPGMARSLNRFVAEVAAAHPEVLPFGTVMPGEPDAREIVREAFRLGARGLKLHCHVQQMGADDPRLDEVYEECVAAKRPVVIHSGREPSFPAYGVDVRALCSADRMDRVLRKYPRLKVVVPHLGADEYDAYSALLDAHEGLWLDTTMVIGEYFNGKPPASLFPGRADRLLYGTDFPNVPYAWSHELERLLGVELEPSAREAILFRNAKALFD